MKTLAAIVLARKGRDWVYKPQYKEWLALRLVEKKPGAWPVLQFVRGQWTHESGESIHVIDEIHPGSPLQDLFRLYAAALSLNVVNDRAREIADEFQTKARRAFVEHLSQTERGRQFLQTIRDYLDSFEIPSLRAQMGIGVGRGHQPWGWKSRI